jgi:chromosome segregation ATPase
MQGQMGELSGKMGNLSDRIDTLSDDLNEKIDNLSERVDTLSDDLNGKIDNLSERVDTLSHHVTNIELHLENTTDRNIGLLMEQYKPNADKLDRVAEQVEGIQFDLDGLKRVVIAHSKDINALMKR